LLFLFIATFFFNSDAAVAVVLLLLLTPYIFPQAIPAYCLAAQQKGSHRGRTHGS
jgi:hypothetical protein